MTLASTVCDHHGKVSQGRVAALVGLAIAGALAFGPWLGYPAPEFDVLLLFILGPSGLALWQKLGATQEHAQPVLDKPPPRSVTVSTKATRKRLAIRFIAFPDRSQEAGGGTRTTPRRQKARFI